MAQDILITPGSGEPQILFRGSGTNDTPIELNVLSSYQSASSSGSALLFEGTEGQLFAITDNLSSGVIFSVAGAAGLPFIEADASGDVRLIEYGRYVGVGTGTPAYQLDVFGTGRFSEGIMFGDGTTQTTAAGGGGGSSPTGTASGVAFFGDDNNLTEDSDFYFDTGNNKLYSPSLYVTTSIENDSTYIGLDSAGVKWGHPYFKYYGTINNNGLYVRNNTVIGWSAAADAVSSLPDAQFRRDQADTIAQRRSANPQEFRIYHSGDGSATPTNYERLSIKATGYNYEISPQVNNGTAGSVVITNDTSSKEILVVKGAASQSANLQEWQNSAGTVKASINQNGYAELNGFRASDNVNFNGSAGNQLTFSNANTTFDHQGYLDILIDSNNNGTTDYFRVSKDSRTAANILLNVDNDGNVSGAAKGIFTSGIQFGDGTTQTTAAAGGGTPGGSDTNIQFNNGGAFSGESSLTWNYDTDALTVSGNTLMAGTGVILDVKTTGGTTLFAVEDTTETTLVVNSQDGQTSHPFEVRDAFGLTAASIDVSGNISGNHLSFGDGTTQTTAATASGPPAVVSDTGTAITMVCNTHADKYLRTTANSAVTITFPSGLGCDANSEFTFEQAGSGQITVTGAAGVTINTSSTTKTYTQFSVISMKQVATDTYTLFGDTASF